ncbi:MAG TPA: ATP-grasp domain-containing protein [Coxiellaceae bacterium]|nr:ATP-grasp domain-containing protein [Coxiellaceae bacterium]
MNTLLFVDPLISVSYLCTTFRNNNCKLLALYGAEINNLNAEEKRIRFRPDLFDEVFLLNSLEELPAIIEKLQTYQIDFILNGEDNSVVLTDLVAEKLNFSPRNDCRTSLYRSNKYEMQNALIAAGIEAIPQMLIENKKLNPEQINTLRNWDPPWIIKPNNAGCSVGLQLINNLEELEAYLLKAPTLYLGNPITSYLLQEYIRGTEYFVDSFSANGEHFTTSIVKYEKLQRGAHTIYHTAMNVNPKENEFSICKEYVTRVLTAVGLNNGFAHTEIFLSKKGPRLIEVNPRLSGAEGMINRMSELVRHYSQPRALLNYLNHQPQPTLSDNSNNAYGCIYFLQAFEAINIRGYAEHKLKELASYREHILLKVLPHEITQAPAHLTDTICYILLCNSDQATLEKDIKQLELMEKNNELFE